MADETVMVRQPHYVASQGIHLESTTTQNKFIQNKAGIRLYAVLYNMANLALYNFNSLLGVQFSELKRKATIQNNLNPSTIGSMLLAVTNEADWQTGG